MNLDIKKSAAAVLSFSVFNFLPRSKFCSSVSPFFNDSYLPISKSCVGFLKGFCKWNKKFPLHKRVTAAVTS